MSDLHELLTQLLTEEEGRIPWVYPDHLGYLTIGVGHLVDRRKGGRLPDPIIDALLGHDIDQSLSTAAQIPGFARLNPVQQAVVVSMVFQLGAEPFDSDGYLDFKNFLRALATGDVKGGARHGRDSKWAKQDTPRRAERQMQMLESGLWIPKEAG